MTLKTLTRLLTAGMLVAASATSVAAGWPEKPVRVIVVYPGGGVSDSVTRAVSEKLAGSLGVPFVVENKGGAGGTVGMADISRATPDGYTIGFSSISPLALSPLINKVQYDPQKDIAPVASVMVSPVILLGTKAFQGNSVDDIISQSKASPGVLRWATSGPGSVGHLMLEQFQHAAGIEVTHIPYKGSAQQQTDALGGQFELISTNAGPAMTGNIEKGALKPLAIAAPARVSFLPNVPTFTELGYPKANMMSVFGFFAPAGTPKPVIDKLNAEVNTIVASPDIQKLLVSSSNIPATGTPEQFAQDIQDEYQANRALIENAGLSLK
jgi:tripartite-type tricarboxylate transporter receptor subunit TctC